MAVLTTQNIVAAGTKPTFAAAAATDYAEVGSGTNTFAVYKNTSSTACNVTVEMDHVTLLSGDVHPDKVIALPITTGELWIPLRKEYADSAEAGIGRAVLKTSAQDAGITVAIVRMG
jgi:hypothetical protein